MKVGDYVSFETYHPSGRTFTTMRRGIIIGAVQRAGDVLYSINDGKQTFGLVGRSQIRNIISSS